jgi:hypothetical protein
MSNNIDYNHICHKCNYKTDLLSSYKKHLESTLHKTGRRKVRVDRKVDIYKCDKCNYETANKIIFKQYELNEHSNKEEREKEFKYYCKICDIGTFSKDNWNIHESSQRHIKHEKNYK